MRKPLTTRLTATRRKRELTATTGRSRPRVADVPVRSTNKSCHDRCAMAEPQDVSYRELSVNPALVPYVRLVWAMETSGQAAFGPAERILPDGVIETIFHYGLPFEMRYAGEAFALQPTACVVSQTRRFIEIRPSGRSGFVAVRFHPWAASRFFSEPLTELADRLTPAEEVWGREVTTLLESMADASSLRSRSELVQGFLIRRLADRERGIDRIAEAIWFRRGDCRVAALGREFGLSERTLERRFAADVGMTPKQFARLARFLSACELIRRSGAGSTIASIAAAAGYFDHAHCAAEFRELAGMSPAAYAAAQKVSALTIE